MVSTSVPRTENGGSIPPRTFISPLAQLVEHRSYEPKATGSSPVGRIPLVRHDVKLNFSYSYGGRAVKAIDLKSIGLCPRRFKSCP